MRFPGWVVRVDWGIRVRMLGQAQLAALVIFFELQKNKTGKIVKGFIEIIFF